MTGDGGNVVVVGYSSLDSATTTRAFHGVDATTILETPLVSSTPNPGGIAHMTSAVSASGAATYAVSWVGDDRGGRQWRNAVASEGAGITGVVTSGTRTPSATLIEVGTGGTICLFDPGDCHSEGMTVDQLDIVSKSAWVLLTVAPRNATIELLNRLPDHTRLVWAVKRDEEAYTPAIVRRILQRASIVSFSRAERAYVTVDGASPESTVREGCLVIETRGADGVSWSFASSAGATRRGTHSVERVHAPDTTGAGDTFIGTLVGLVAAGPQFSALTEYETAGFIAEASAAARDLLRRRHMAEHSDQAELSPN